MFYIFEVYTNSGERREDLDVCATDIVWATLKVSSRIKDLPYKDVINITSVSVVNSKKPAPELEAKKQVLPGE